MKPATFASEADLCQSFTAALPEGWTAYPETAGWDILLVRQADGFQIGIEAKLKLNAVVLSQALEGHDWSWRRQGPDCRAVLVPRGAVVAGVGMIADHLAVTVIEMKPPGAYYRPDFNPALPTPKDRYGGSSETWHELCPMERCRLPEYVPDVAAGSSAPVQLTDWKIKAIKLAIMLDKQGTVSRADFKALRLDVRRWIDSRWLLPSERGLVRGGMPDFRAQHPMVYAQIEAEADEWIPKVRAGVQLVLKTG